MEIKEGATTMQTTKRVFALLSHSTYSDQIASIHADGCRDIRREQQRHGSAIHLLRASKVDKVVAHWLDAEMVEMGYTARDIKIHNCAR